MIKIKIIIDDDDDNNNIMIMMMMIIMIIMLLLILLLSSDLAPDYFSHRAQCLDVSLKLSVGNAWWNG